MNALVPVPALNTLKREMDRLFDRLWDDDTKEFPVIGEWTPALDLSETKDAITARVEIPGIEPKDVHVTLQDQMLTIRGEKKIELEEKGSTYFRHERSHGTFTRMIRLPANVENAKVQATFKNGVLTVVLPKTPEAKGAEIPVKIA